MTSIEFIRKYKEPRAKIGLRVTYAGHPYRIANTSGDGLKLRNEILCHAKDDLLDYEPAKGTHEVTLYRKMQRLESELAIVQAQLTEALANEKAAVDALQHFAEQNKHIQEIVKRKGKVYFNPELSLYSVQATSYLENIPRALKLKHIHNAAEIVAAWHARQSAGQPAAVPAGDRNEKGA